MFLTSYFSLLTFISLPRINSEPPHFFPYRGIYLNYAAGMRFKEYLPYIKNSELNCVVVDFKEAIGVVPYNTNVELAKTIGAVLQVINLESLVEDCKKHGIRLIARIVVFQDSILAWYNKGKYSIRSLDDKIWKDGHGRYWTNPCLKEVQLYNIEIAKDLAKRGVPEIQFDYIRFPSASGKFKPYRIDCEDKEKVIVQFLELARKELKPLGVTIAGDVYGYALWLPSLKDEGQNLRLMATLLDVICPMLYPSHFHPKEEWSPDPREREYRLVFKSVAKGESLIGESKFVPYIQGFNLRSPGFGPAYIANQIHAARESNAWGYIVWNARSDYTSFWELLKR
ncbi:MAG: putative glycoside hydrolase [bacterium]|nr:putative glycoside hydrolase [bacterium]